MNQLSSVAGEAAAVSGTEHAARVCAAEERMAKSRIEIDTSPEDIALLVRGMTAVSRMIAEGMSDDGLDHGVVSDAAFLLADLGVIVEGAIERMAGKLAMVEVNHG